AEDDVRLWVNRAAGYAIALPGAPWVVEGPDGVPRYDAVVQLSDLPLNIGIRIDTIPTQIEPTALVTSLALAYAKNRVDAAVKGQHVAEGNLPRGAVAGISCTYSLRQADASGPGMMEHLYVAARPAGANVEVLYLTARFHVPGVNPFQWRQFRGAIFGQQRWDGSGLDGPPPRLFPDGVIAHPGVSLAFTDHGMAEASAKAELIARQPEEVVSTLMSTLLGHISEEAPPMMELPHVFSHLIPSRMRQALPEGLAEVLLRNFDEVTTFHDLRAWAWQCVWAVGNPRG
ncbi:MAG TPA: hypothetical protein VGC41_29420, partial [Kofleriaceae bacterium]